LERGLDIRVFVFGRQHEVVGTIRAAEEGQLLPGVGPHTHARHEGVHLLLEELQVVVRRRFNHDVEVDSEWGQAGLDKLRSRDRRRWNIHVKTEAVRVAGQFQFLAHPIRVVANQDFVWIVDSDEGRTQVAPMVCGVEVLIDHFDELVSVDGMVYRLTQVDVVPGLTQVGVDVDEAQRVCLAHTDRFASVLHPG